MYFTDQTITQGGDLIELNFEVLKCRNEIYQRIEHKEYMRKMG